MCSVTGEPTQSSSRCISTLKDSSVPLTTEQWTSQKWSPSNRQHTACGEDRKYILEHKQNTQNNGNRAKPLKRLLETLFLAIKTLHTFVFTYITSAVKPVHFFMVKPVHFSTSTYIKYIQIE